MTKQTFTQGELRVIAETDHVQCGDAAAMANMLLAVLAEREADKKLIALNTEMFRNADRDIAALRQRIAELEALTAKQEKWIKDVETTMIAATDRAEAAEKLVAELAGMDSEPVIIVDNDGGDALAYRRLIQSFAPGTKLYTAPPAPVAVPDVDPSFGAMMRALDTFYADDDVPERAMLAAFKILLADVGSQPQQPATDNTAQQFESLAASAPATPTFTAEELKSFGREMWFDGWRTSPHTPSPSYDCNQAFRGTDVAERLATSAGSGKQ